MAKKITRRSFLKRFLYSSLGVFGIGGGTYYYAKFLEPSMLKIKEESIYSPKLPESFTGMKIVHFGDTHLGFHYSLNQLEKLVDQINQLNPDIVFFTGDLIDDPKIYPPNQFQTCSEILSAIKAPFGKFWIYGNHDHGGYGTDIIKDVMKLGGFQLLQNEAIEMEQNSEKINIGGLDDVMLGRPDLDRTFETTNFDHFTILLCHEPDFADQTIRYPVDVQFSGHSHGGQIQIPLIGYVITPPFAEKYVEGKHTIGDSLQLYITRGIGTTRLPYRFLCKPEINVYTLENSQID
ncbi:metallophosphoesterase [Salirhabdus sp. Marseille-P4669]|uniref:metallophosphoesterase n=1 Tax=Salirhabdus sp. Marseille-P4669 TaxID=2042310 RepID=UPI001F4735FB|nr:metallophosphoesterase [Salirhabdus sp. Marseille-P4669]